MSKKHVSIILGELRTVLATLDDRELDRLASGIRSARRIVLTGAGRVGLAVRGFAMRLAHLGLKAHMLGDATVPSVGRRDLLVVASGSGETETIFQLVSIAKRNGARIALVTGSPDSRMGKLADVIVRLRAPSKTRPVAGFTSAQPMTTLNEQCLGILFDALVLRLMRDLRETHETMWKRHSNLE
jgi:6-phospho-3-hexuloisomerase